MNKLEFTKLVKPLIKECIKEVIFEDGTLSKIIAEVVKGTKPLIKESVQVISSKPSQQDNSEQRKKLEAYKQELKQERNVVQEQLTKQMGGFDPFNGTKPLEAQSAPGNQNVSSVIEGDPGLDMSEIDKLIPGGIFNKRR